MKNILVFGGTTFVSEETAKLLISKKYNVDILTRGILPLKYSGVGRHIICDRTNPNKLASALKKHKYDIIVDVNARNNSDIDLALSALDISSIEKYVLCSTASVFQIPPDGNINDERDLDFSSENPYIVGKHQAEQRLIDSGIPYVIIRPTYIYGENNTLRREIMIFNAIKDDVPIFFPKTECFINPVYSYDVAQTILFSVKNESLNNSAFLLGGIDVVSLQQFVEICSIVCKKNAVIINSRKAQDDFIRIPFLPVSVVVTTSQLLTDNIKFTALSEGLMNVFCHLNLL